MHQGGGGGCILVIQYLHKALYGCHEQKKILPDDSSLSLVWQINEQRHEISNNVVCATSKGSDRTVCSELEYSMTLRLLTEHHFEFLSLEGGCTGSYEPTHVKMPHPRKYHVTAHISIKVTLSNNRMSINSCLTLS